MATRIRAGSPTIAPSRRARSAPLRRARPPFPAPRGPAPAISRAIGARVIRPALAGQIPISRAADAVASARTAALVDPDGESLTKCLAEIDGQPALRIAAE